MKSRFIFLTLLILSFGQVGHSQVFANGEVDGPIGSPSVPPSWQDVPDTDPASQALAPVQATSDVLDGTGPNTVGGIVATPQSGTSCVSGLKASTTMSGGFFWHEGIMQTVNGFTIGDDYTICFYQAVVKQQNATDTSGAWSVYMDNTLIGNSAVSVSQLIFNEPNVNWELRSVTFTATAASHVIKFLPFDDDPESSTSIGIYGALRMGIDNISFGPPPSDPTITAAGPFCSNSPSVILSAVDPGGTWTGTGIVDGVTGEFDPSVAGLGSHVITYELATGCAGTVTDNITIDVSASLDPSWTSPGAICESAGVIDLNALITGDAGGTWSGTGVTGNNFDPTGLSGNISITYTIGAAPCLGTDMQDINVTSDGDATWTAPTGLCSSAAPVDLSTLVTGTAGGTFTGTGITGNMFDPSVGTQNITYTVGTAPCDATLMLTITIGAAVDPSWTTLSLCAGDPAVNLNAQVTGDPGGTWSGTGVTGNTFDPASGTQDVTYTVGSVGCSDFSTQTILVVDLNLNVVFNSISCNGLLGGDATANVTGGSGSYSYSWDTSPVQTTQSINGLGAGTYTVTVTDDIAGCVATSQVIIVEPNAITTTMSASSACLPDLGTAAVVVGGGAGGFSYSWNNSPSTTSSAINLDSAMHVVTVTDGNGCTKLDSILVQSFTSPTVTTYPNATITYGECISLGAAGADVYQWEPDYELTCDDCQTPIACPQITTTYCVTGVDVNGCPDTSCMKVNVEIICGEVFVPTAFSPNGDGENDLLCVYSDCLENFSFVIYNRWGEKVFETGEKNICWDGRWKDKDLNTAVFVYMLRGFQINGEEVNQKGNISLIR